MTVHYKNVTKNIGLKSFKDMLNSTGKLVAESFASNCHHKLIHFPYEKELLLKSEVTFFKMETTIALLPWDPIWTPTHICGLILFHKI